jgi:hypothetical protein
MINLKQSLSSLDLIWRRLEEHLTANSPRFWGLQIHIVLLATACGLALCVVLQLMFASPQLASSQVWLVGLMMLLQFSFLVLWGTRAIAVPRPSNVLGYSFPPLLILALCITAIMMGPAVLYTLQIEPFRGASFFLGQVPAQIYFVTAIARFFGGLAQDGARSLAKWVFASSLVMGISYTLLTMLVPSALGLFALTLLFLFVSAGRLSFCIVSGARRPSDLLWLASLLLLPFAFVASWALSSASHGIDVIKLVSEHLSGHPTSILWLLMLVLLIVVSCWIDFISWVRAHVMMLPVRE